jgi:lipopolysaccharide export system ATP-binding protein
MGEIVGLLGPNGAGKTTTFYMVVGMVKPDEGRILLSGKDITNYPMYLRAREAIGYLAQEPSIFRKMSVENNIKAILEFSNLTAKEQDYKLEHLLDDLHIQHIRKNYGYSLSGGERRRVEIARSMATSPNFILLDEPFAGVDPIAVAEIQSIVRALKKRGLGVLITDHSVRETLEITDRAYIMNQGRVLVSGTPEEIAQSEVARRIYLGENFKIEEKQDTDEILIAPNHEEIARLAEELQQQAKAKKAQVPTEIITEDEPKIETPALVAETLNIHRETTTTPLNVESLNQNSENPINTSESDTVDHTEEPKHE